MCFDLALVFASNKKSKKELCVCFDHIIVFDKTTHGRHTRPLIGCCVALLVKFCSQGKKLFLCVCFNHI